MNNHDHVFSGRIPEDLYDLPEGSAETREAGSWFYASHLGVVQFDEVDDCLVLVLLEVNRRGRGDVYALLDEVLEVLVEGHSRIAFWDPSPAMLHVLRKRFPELVRSDGDDVYYESPL